MLRSRTHSASLILAVVIAFCNGGARAQQPCNPPVPVEVSVGSQLGISSDMQANTVAPNSYFIPTLWEVSAYGTLYSSSSSHMILPLEEPVLVCATGIANTPDQAACMAQGCALISTVLDSLYCPPLDFTATVIGPQTLTFAVIGGMQSSTPSSTTWSFSDDNSSSYEFQPTHTFAPGLHQVCVTVHFEYCTRTTCKWLYLGGGTQDCQEVLLPSIRVERIGNTVGVVDISTTSGLHSTTHWDFGDGHTATGHSAMHTYDNEWAMHTICAQVSAWGAAVADTCRAETCHHFGWAVGTQTTIAPQPDLLAYPSPFQDQLSLSWPSAPGSWTWELIGADGRVALQGSESRGPTALSTVALAPGAYLLRARSGSAAATLRVIKT